MRQRQRFAVYAVIGHEQPSRQALVNLAPRIGEGGVGRLPSKGVGKGEERTEQRHAFLNAGAKLIRLDVAESLREAGYEAVEVSSADQAMALLGRETFMPGTLNGLDLAWAIHRAAVLALT
jgi:hypothetical protein